jgi:hypothetical protein
MFGSDAYFEQQKGARTATVGATIGEVKGRRRGERAD